MTHYRIDGHIYYITSNVYNRLSIFTRSPFVLPLLDSLNYYRYKYRFKLLGYVIMPDHLHLLIFPQDAALVGDMMRDFKKFTATRIIRQAQIEQNQAWLVAFSAAGSETGRSENKVWQDDFWEMNIFSERFVRQKLNYIHRNPVRAGLVNAPEAYPYSSYRNYISDDDSWIEIDRGWQSI
jgi:REP element-mobilizing transposase RayT